jgi:hypothetical protein
MRNLWKIPKLPDRYSIRLVLYLQILLISVTCACCAARDNNEGQVQFIANLELETTPVFRLAISPDDQHIAILTWKNYARSLNDQGATSIRIRIINMQNGSIIQHVELPDQSGQQLINEVNLYWQDQFVLHVYFPSAHYIVDSRSGGYSSGNTTDSILPSAQRGSDECIWSPRRLYCASVESGTLYIQEIEGDVIWRQSICDRSYPVCDRYPLIWTSNDKLIFVAEESIWLWSH